jgi:predicted RNA-binding Zn-ribbon protein involved in translation (DUF1610 family)
MLKFLGASLKAQWARLSTSSGSRRLSVFSLILLFGLDIYVFGLTFQGMEDVARTIAVPQSTISSECETMTEVFLKDNVAAKADSLRDYVYASESGTADRSSEGTEVLPVCIQIRDKLRTFAGDPVLGGLFRELDQRVSKIDSLHSDMEELKSSYDTALLEKIADQKREDSILPAEATKIKGLLAAKAAALAGLEKKQAETRRILENQPAIRDYTAFAESLPIAAEFGRARQEYERLAFWYPVKVLAAQVSFLLPLLLLAILWNRRALNRRSDVQTLITSHLILVCAVPVFLIFLEFIYELLPHRLLADLVETLERLNLGFLWNYVAIVGGIVISLALILIAQKTYFSPARQRSVRLRKTLCLACGEKLRSADQPWCEFCGTNQMAVCARCGKSHRLLAYHCDYCGADLVTKTPA